MNGRKLSLLAVLLIGGCEPADDVRILPLPPLDRPSPEARLGLPEIGGIWRFVGWEIVRGDSTSLERTFPSFGELRVETQRLDSIAGTFVLGGTPVRVVGDVRRDGGVSLVTMADRIPVSFIAGRVAEDTLWLELTSVLPPDDWPRDSRAGFVRGPVAEPIAWLRGARPGDEIAPQRVDSVGMQLPGQQYPGVEPPGPAGPPPDVDVPRPAPGPGAVPSRPGVQTPAPGPQQPPAQQPPAQQPPPEVPEPEPEPETEPEPEPEPEQRETPQLLGEPVG